MKMFSNKSYVLSGVRTKKENNKDIISYLDSRKDPKPNTISF